MSGIDNNELLLFFAILICFVLIAVVQAITTRSIFIALNGLIQNIIREERIGDLLDQKFNEAPAETQEHLRRLAEIVTALTPGDAGGFDAWLRSIVDGKPGVERPAAGPGPGPAGEGRGDDDSSTAGGIGIYG